MVRHLRTYIYHCSLTLLDSCELKSRAKKVYQDDHEKDLIQRWRQKLHADIVEWCQLLISFCPQVKDQVLPVESDKPESYKIPLPSCFAAHARTAVGLDEDFASLEYALREGQAHDALEAIRVAILSHNYSNKKRRDEAQGQYSATRAQQFLHDLTEAAKYQAKWYRRVRKSLIRLGMPDDNGVLQRLEYNQLWAKDVTKPRQLGDGRLPDPWFWRAGRPNNLPAEQEEAWVTESKLDS